MHTEKILENDYEKWLTKSFNPENGICAETCEKDIFVGRCLKKHILKKGWKAFLSRNGNYANVWKWAKNAFILKNI